MHILHQTEANLIILVKERIIELEYKLDQLEKSGIPGFKLKKDEIKAMILVNKEIYHTLLSQEAVSLH